MKRSRKPARRAKSIAANDSGIAGKADRHSSVVRRIGFFEAETYTGFSGSGIEKAALPDLLLRALAPGDEHPIEAQLRALAEEMGAVSELVPDEEQARALGLLICSWTCRLLAATEIVRRYRVEVRA